MPFFLIVIEGVARILLIKWPRADVRNEMDKTSDKILCVGLVCLDIVNYCDHYPSEDEDVRASNQKWHKGGNAANTASVLRMLGRGVEFFGTIGSGMETE